MGSIEQAAEVFSDEEATQYVGNSKLQLALDLTAFPKSIFALAQTLTHLDLSKNHRLAVLPDISALRSLKILFLSSCAFKTFPNLSKCQNLEMVAFKSNGMTTIPEGCLPPKLRWLILTDNAIESLPNDIGKCTNLTKCMLAGNNLTTLPDTMRNCKKLTLLRLSRNKLSSLPAWLFTLPSLAFLNFAGNPCCPSIPQAHAPLPSVPWTDLTISSLLGEGASGVISLATYHTQSVAVKVFKGALTSDGSPFDELAATIAAGIHPNLVSPLALTHPPSTTTSTSPALSAPADTDHPALIMSLIPPHYENLGLPPSLVTCARDTFPPDATLPIRVVLSILRGVASAAAHLHSRSVAHGDLYAHNILNNSAGHALLGDFGAATVYLGVEDWMRQALQQIEVQAFGFLIEDLLGLVSFDAAIIGEKEWETVQRLKELEDKCVVGTVRRRPLFEEIVEDLGAI